MSLAVAKNTTKTLPHHFSSPTTPVPKRFQAIQNLVLDLTPPKPRLNFHAESLAKDLGGHGAEQPLLTLVGRTSTFTLNV